MYKHIIIVFEDKNVKNYILKEFGDEEGEWEAGNDDSDYELFFYTYYIDKNAMLLTKGDDGDRYDMLYKEIQEIFSGFKYSIVEHFTDV